MEHLTNDYIKRLITLTVITLSDFSFIVGETVYFLGGCYKTFKTKKNQLKTVNNIMTRNLD